jgi:hypothetical protein
VALLSCPRLPEQATCPPVLGTFTIGERQRTFDAVRNVGGLHHRYAWRHAA